MKAGEAIFSHITPIFDGKYLLLSNIHYYFEYQIGVA